MKLSVTIGTLVLLFVAGLICTVYAQDDETVDIGDLPTQLSDRLNIPLAAAELLCVSLFLGWFVFPALLLSKDHVTQSFVVALFGLPILGFSVLMEWLDWWFFLVFCLVIALMYAGKAREFLSGG